MRSQKLSLLVIGQHLYFSLHLIQTLHLLTLMRKVTLSYYLCIE